MTGRRRAARIAVALVMVAAIAALYASPLRENLSREEIYRFVSQLRGYWYGPLIYIALFAICAALAVPASVFVFSAGLIWGWKMGGTWALIGGLVAAIVSYFIGRFLGEGLLARFGSVGRVVAKQVDHAGFRSLLLLRFVPGLPFAALNYSAGVAGVTLGDYIPATLLGMAPSVYVFAYCADALFNGTMSEGEVVKRLLIVGVLMISIVLIPTLLKRRLKDAASTEG